MGSARIICPNGHLGFAPLKLDSFRLGVEARPDFIAADSGSDDVGPGPLGADVCILGGRSSDAALFAAAALHRGHPEPLAYYLGKVLECASFCAEPYGGKETVLGEIIDGGVHVTAMHPGQRCTPASVAGHAM